MQLVMDSLRYWVEEMRVDGFRFDLATTLLRERHGEYDPWGGFARAVQQDPVLGRVKLIAEPWDVGPNGYQVGGFPAPFGEWNGKYRDEVRAYWKGDGGQVGDLAYRLTGSSDLYAKRNRPQVSVNFITAHDGFTLKDLVSYNEKHNEANGEGNNDGESDNASWNCGVEGPTADPEILALRMRQRRNLMATLLLSQGVPMILHGDEIGRTQGGNNNVYCQDNLTSWVDWDLSDDDRQFLRFVQRVVALRREHPAFRRRHFFRGTAEAEGHDVLWLTPQGREMTQKEWETEFARTLGLLILGSSGEDHRSATGVFVPDDDFLLLTNAHYGEIPFLLPSVPAEARWQAVLDTSNPLGLGLGGFFKPGDEYPLEARSLVLLMNPRLETPAL
jgi:glycogen operon protein